MASLKLYNANNNNDPMILKLATMEWSAYEDIPASGEYTIAGSHWTVEKTGAAGWGNVHFEGEHVYITGANIQQMINGLMDTFHGYESADLFNWYPAAVAGLQDDDSMLSAGTNAFTFPGFKIEYTPGGDVTGGDYFPNANFGWDNSHWAAQIPVGIGLDGSHNALIGFMALTTGDPEDAFGGVIFGRYVIQSYKNYGAQHIDHTDIWITISSNITLSYFEGLYQLDPGNKNFRPVSVIARKPAIGGGSTSGSLPGYSTDTLTQPNAPDETHASAAASGLLNAYVIDKTNLAHLCYNLFTPTWSSAFTHLFWEPLDSIISLQVFPCTPDTGTPEYVKVLGYMSKKGSSSDTLRADWENSQAAPLTKQFKVLDFGSITISEMFESFLDYDASDFTLFLPFIGEISMPVGEVMGSTINVQYTVDFFTGMCVANVLIEKSAELGDGQNVSQYAQHSYMGNCAVQMPLSSVQYGNIIGSLAQAASMGLHTGLAGTAGSLAMSAANGGLKPTVQTKGTIGANAGFCGILQPYITITRPIPVEPENYQTVVGYPSFVDATLGTCEGFCKCMDIDLTGINGMTENEARRVKSMCQAGIYI